MSNEKENKEVTGGIDLNLVKKLVSELEATLAGANEIRKSKGDVHQYMVETAKATGLAMGIMREATMLVSDINLMTQMETASGSGILPGSKKNALENALSELLTKSSGPDRNKN